VTVLVRLDDVQVRAGARLLLDVPRLAVAAGERVAVVGPNGAGKSTLLKLIGARVAPSQGRVQVLGHVLTPATRPAGRGLRALRRELGLLTQGLHLVPRLTALENAVIGALGRLHGAASLWSLLRRYPPAVVGEASERLEALGLAALAQVRADRLSGGERQKLALVRVQMQRPRLVLADEPTAALDPSATAQVCRALQALAQPPGHALLAVVHDVDLLPALAQRVVGMAEGAVQWDLPIGQVTPTMLRALYRSTEEEERP
jgi:phosphonate transport system ATP-binding protein